MISRFPEMSTRVDVANYERYANERKATEKRHVKIHLEIHVYTKSLNDTASVNNSFPPAPLFPHMLYIINIIKS